jgi:hydroxyisourate hydrolase
MKNLVPALVAGAALAFSSAAHAQATKSAGDLSTIVMNMEQDGFAVGMTIELYEVSAETPRKVAQASSGEDGRAVLIASGPLPLGKYEMRFHVGDYFRKAKVATGDPPFLDFVPIRFSITDPIGHYHVPLICTPWSYTTYRGS